MNKIEEIKNLKSLLDAGAITEQEFNNLKKIIFESNDASTDLNISASKNLNEKQEKKTPLNQSNLSQKEALKTLRKLDWDLAQENLIFCIENYNLRIAELLLIAGLNPNEPIYDKKQKVDIFPLHQAAKFSEPDMVLLLVEYGAKIDLPDDFGETPLFYAIGGGKLNNIKLLIEKGANLNHLSNAKVNPLFLARRLKKNEIIKLLLTGGAHEMNEREIKENNSFNLYRRVFAGIKIASILIGVIFVIYLYNLGSSSDSSKSNSEDTAYMKCRYCSKEIIEKNNQGIMCYTKEPDGIGILTFYSGSKYDVYCSEECAAKGIMVGYGYTEH